MAQFNEDAPRDDETGEERKAWHRYKPGPERARAAFEMARKSDTINASRREIARRDLSVIEGVEISNFNMGGYGGVSEPFRFKVDDEDEDGTPTPVLINLAKAIVDTMTSRLAALNRPKTKVVTSYGSWKDRRAAVEIDRLLEADFRTPQGLRYPTVWHMTEHGYKLAHGALGSVAVKVSEYPGCSKPIYHLLDTFDIAFDQDELTYGQPLSIAITTWWNPHVLASMLPDEYHADIFERLEEVPEGISPFIGDQQRAKMVRVVETYRVAVGSEPGAYCMALKDGLDVTDPDAVEYPYEDFPLAFYHAEPNMVGPWAQSTTSVMFEALKMLNQCVLSMSKSEQMLPKAALHVNPDAVNDDDLRNIRDFMLLRKRVGDAGGDHTTVPSEPPTVLLPAPFDRMNIEWVNWLIQIIHDVVGMSESATTGTREKGVPSAQGQRAIAALGAERFAQSTGNYIHWVAVDIARLSLRAMRRIHERDGSFTRHWARPARPSSSSVKFLREVSSDALAGLDDNKYILVAEPTSGQRNTPADRTQQAVEAVEMGIVAPARLPGLMSHLDVPGEVGGLDAQREWLEECIDQWLFAPLEELEKPGFYKSPLPGMNIEDATLQVLDAFYRADMELAGDDEEHRLDYFTTFLAELDIAAQQKAAAQQPPPGQQQLPPGQQQPPALPA